MCRLGITAYAEHMALAAEDLEQPEFSLGDRLRKARHHVGIKSAERMAELLTEVLEQDVKASTVNAWEAGTNQPTRGVRLEDVVKAYALICTREGTPNGRQVSVAWLWGYGYRLNAAGEPMLFTVVPGPDEPVQTTLPFDRQLTTV